MKNYFISGLVALSMGYLSLSQAAASDTKFSIAQIPDTQSFFYHPGWADPGQIIDMYQWIIDDHKSGNNNYKYIFHVGDIIELDGLYAGGALNPESEWEWSQANTIFTTIENNMNAANVKIPYGFVTGNHDTQNLKQGKDVWGNGDFFPITTQQAITFLKLRYENKTNSPHQSLNIPDTYPQYAIHTFPNNNYLISYYTFQVAGVNFIALNLPYFLAAEAPMGAGVVNSFIDSHQNDSLVIINSHDCEQGAAFAGHRNVFMVICGHVPDVVKNDGTRNPIPVDKRGRHSPYPDFYVYRFDYQSPGSSNLPQHPLIRTYDFTLNTDNGTLSWNATDIQAWVAEGKEFQTVFYNQTKPTFFGYKKGNYGWASNAVFDTSRKSIGSGSINYKDYLGPSSTCAMPVENSQPSGCNKKVGSNVTICWDSPTGSNPLSYVIEDYNHNPKKPPTTDKSFVDQGVGPSSNYVYYVHANCEGGASSEDLTISVPAVPGNRAIKK